MCEKEMKKTGLRWLLSHLAQSSCWKSYQHHCQVIHRAASGFERGLEVLPPYTTAWKVCFLLCSCPPVGGWTSVDLQINRRCVKSVKKRGRPDKYPMIVLILTFHLHDDWLRLYRSGADAQSAAILPGIHSLHMFNAVTQYMRTHVKLRYQPVTSFFHLHASHTWQWRGESWLRRWGSGARWSPPVSFLPGPGRSSPRWWWAPAWHRGCRWSSWI